MFFSYLFLISGIGLFIFYLHVSHSLFLPNKYSYKNTTAIINDASIVKNYIDVDSYTTFETFVSYSYEVDDAIYESNKLYKSIDTYGNMNKTELKKYLKTNNIIKGACVEISYDGANPENAYILEFPPGNGLMILLMSIIFGAISFFSFMLIK